MSTTAIDFTYRYQAPSEIVETDSGCDIRFAACDAKQEQKFFFGGRLLAPRDTGLMLYVLSQVVRTHFFKRIPPNLDPVVTSNETVLRFEGFSGCCGVYARVDVPQEAFECEHVACGTTNVDFNNAMLASLLQLRDRDEVRLAVGDDEVTLSRNSETVVERKVKLPVRWIKGFSEVQAYQPSMEMKLEVAGDVARKFINDLPGNNGPRGACFATLVGRTLRLSTHAASNNAVEFQGTHRLKVLAPVMRSAKKMRVWQDVQTGVTGWEVFLKAGRLFLLLSPEVYRGFSGEGQALQHLADTSWKETLPTVQRLFEDRPQWEIEPIVHETQMPIEHVRAALTVLGCRGLVGYDATRGLYFNRKLPFDLERVEELQPRLKSARKLLEEDRIRLLKRSEDSDDEIDLEVESQSDVVHLVRLRPAGDRCSCIWFSKHQGARGPCKHVLAAQLFLESADDESER